MQFVFDLETFAVNCNTPLQSSAVVNFFLKCTLSSQSFYFCGMEFLKITDVIHFGASAVFRPLCTSLRSVKALTMHRQLILFDGSSYGHVSSTTGTRVRHSHAMTLTIMSLLESYQILFSASFLNSYFGAKYKRTYTGISLFKVDYIMYDVT